jgi:hypothetical protein
MNLSTSQMYIQWTWFITFTLNQKEHRFITFVRLEDINGVDQIHSWLREYDFNG